MKVKVKPIRCFHVKSRTLNHSDHHSLAFFRSSPADLQSCGLVDRRATKPSHSKGLPATRTGQTISLIMKNLLIAISNSATISSEGLIVQLLGVLIADVLIMDPHNAHLAISRFMPHASRRAPA